jgi:TonB family protein
VEEREHQRPGRGIFVVIVLALIFFTLLILLIRTARTDEASVPSEERWAYVVPLQLRLRSEPSPQASVVGALSRGTRVQVVDAAGPWIQIVAGEQTGWVERSALEGEDERAKREARVVSIRALPPLDGIVREAASLYAGPGLFFPIVGRLEPRTEVKVFTRDHEFYAVDLGNEVGYVEVDAIDLSPAAGDTMLQIAAASAEPDAPTTTSFEPPPREVEPPPDPEPVERPRPRPPVAAAVDTSRIYPSVPAGGTRPRAVQRVSPAYPQAARSARVEGSVILRIVVMRDGSVRDVQVIKDLSHGLGEAARRAVSQWRYEPATYQGQAINVYDTVTVNYQMTQ